MTEDDLLTAGLDRWEGTAKMLNDIVLTSGFIDSNDPRIWGGVLNAWENEDWESVLTVVGLLLHDHPEFFRDNHVKAFHQAASTLLKYNKEFDRVLDKRTNKKTAWRMIMTLREVWNRVEGVYLPNRNP